MSSYTTEELLFEKRQHSNSLIRFLERFGGIAYLLLLFVMYVIYFEHTPFAVMNYLAWHRRRAGTVFLHRRVHRYFNIIKGRINLLQGQVLQEGEFTGACIGFSQRFCQHNFLYFGDYLMNSRSLWSDDGD